MSQSQADSQLLIHQQDGATPHFNHDVREYFDAKIPRRWIERHSRYDFPRLP